MSSTLNDENGGVAIIAAIILPIMIGFAALATEYSYFLTKEIEQQRVTDVASYAGALAYGKATSEVAMQASAKSIAELHGIPTGNVTVSIVTSPRNAAAKAVSVVVSSPQPIYLAKVVGALDVTIQTTSLAEIGSGTEEAACIIALDPASTGITMSGGTTLSAPECTIASNATITSPCGTSIVTKQALYNSASAPEQPEWCRSIQKADKSPAPIVKAATADPLESHKGVLAAYASVKDTANLKGPASPGAVRGSDLDFNPWDRTKREALATALAGQGCTAAFDNNTWTVTCDASRDTFTFGNLLIESSLLLEFDLNRDIARKGAANYNFTSIKSQGGGNYRFPAGTYVVSAGITMGGSEARFGAGSFQVGKGPCGFSICGGNNGILSFAGPSVFELPAGILVSGGLDARLGGGDRNSYRFGMSQTGRAIDVQSGSLILAGAKGSATTFEIAGRIETGGGTCLALPAIASHEINGSVNVQGALELGAGAYLIDGYLALGQSSGGSSTCNGRTTSLLANNVTLVLSGKERMSGGACDGTAFCASAGYNDMVLVSPTSGTYAQLAVLGPARVKAGATLTGGAGGGIIAGAFYFPNGPIRMDGGASASGTAGDCLTMIGSSISVAGGTSAATKCKKLLGATGSKNSVKLVR
ncbi:putative Flp pilus-assembly TadE/G-like protein [Rhizobium sp. PP-WC-2G-219]|nr:putative Flp pilus-assembly TadE/G-like protein [Rhizobium sp. PP-WC-2G-219]